MFASFFVSLCNDPNRYESDKLPVVAFYCSGNVSLFQEKVFMGKTRLTMRAPDVWESAHFQALFLAWSGFRQTGVVSARPAAGNASRWALTSLLSFANE